MRLTISRRDSVVRLAAKCFAKPSTISDSCVMRFLKVACSLSNDTVCAPVFNWRSRQLRLANWSQCSQRQQRCSQRQQRCKAGGEHPWGNWIVRSFPHLGMSDVFSTDWGLRFQTTVSGSFCSPQILGWGSQPLSLRPWWVRYRCPFFLRRLG